MSDTSQEVVVNETNTQAPAATPEQIAAQTAALHETIKANFNNKVDVVPTKFHFRKVKDEKSGVETKRPTIEIPIPVPSMEGIVDILQAGGKQLSMLYEAVATVIIEQARDYINDNETVTADNFPYATLTWEAIANLPKAERRGGGIAKELWEDFAKDYQAVMPAVLNKPVAAVELACKVFLTKFTAVKTDKKVLALLKSYLAMYINATPNAEQFMECVDFLDKKAAALLEADSSNLLEAL
jgi:hypothetical protein